MFPFMQSAYQGRHFRTVERVSAAHKREKESTMTWKRNPRELINGHFWVAQQASQQLNTPATHSSSGTALVYRSKTGTYNTTQFFQNHRHLGEGPWKFAPRKAYWYARGRPVYSPPPAPSADAFDDQRQMIVWISDCVRIEELKPFLLACEEAGMLMTPAVYKAAIDRITARRRAVFDDRPSLASWDRDGVLEWLDLRCRATEWRDNAPADETDISAYDVENAGPVYHKFRRGLYGMRHLRSYKRIGWYWSRLPLGFQVQGNLEVMGRQPARWEWEYPVDYRLEDPVLGQKM